MSIRDEPIRERTSLQAENEAAPSWGPAVAARVERIRAIDATLCESDEIDEVFRRSIERYPIITRALARD